MGICYPSSSVFIVYFQCVYILLSALLSKDFSIWLHCNNEQENILDEGRNCIWQ